MALNVSAYSSMTTRKGIGGLASGLDTDELVKQMTAMTRSKVAKQLQDRELAVWKRDAYRDISSKLTDFNNKYFSYSNTTTNIMSKKFFETAIASTSSPYIKFTGDAQRAKDVQISKIEQLARKAAHTTGSTDLGKDILSDIVRSEWRDSNIAGQGLVINYGDQIRTIKVSSDLRFDYDTGNRDDEIKAVVADLQKQLEKTDLKDKLEIGIDATGTVSLKKKDPTDATVLGIMDTSSVGLLSSLGMYAGESTNVTEISGSMKADGEMLYLDNKLSGSAVYFEVDGKGGGIVLPSSFHFSASALTKSKSGDYSEIASELAKAYNDEIGKNAVLKDKLAASVTADGTGKLSITFDGQAGSTFKIVGGTDLESLGLTAHGTSDAAVSTVTGNTQMDKVMGIVPKKNLGDTLAGSSINVTLNGISKTIRFNSDDKANYSNPADLANYLNTQIGKAYGTGKVSVSEAGGQLKIDVADDSSVFSIDSASKVGILGDSGALRLKFGESNRLETNKSLAELAAELVKAGKLDRDLLIKDSTGKYSLKVNDTVFSFEETATISDIVGKINSSEDVGVRISFSSLNNNFVFTAKENGEKGRIDLNNDEDGSNLGQILFGDVTDVAPPGSTDMTKQRVTKGADAKMTISLDGGNTWQNIVRSENSFNIDGMNFELTGTMDAAGDPTKNITFTVNSNIDELVTKIKDFVKDYNEVVKQVNSKVTEKRKDQEDKTTTRYLPLTDEQKKEMSEDDIKTWNENAKKGILQNDPYLSKIFTQLRRASSDVVEGTEDALYQIGISTASYAWNDNGVLEIDEEKLKTALLENPEKVTSMFTAEKVGISARMKEVLEDSVGTTLVVVNPSTNESVVRGLLLQVGGRANSPAPDTSMLTQRIEQMSKQLVTLQSRLITEETRYYNKFTQLEKYISAMNSQSSWLSQQFSS